MKPFRNSDENLQKLIQNNKHQVPQSACCIKLLGQKSISIQKPFVPLCSLLSITYIILPIGMYKYKQIILHLTLLYID